MWLRVRGWRESALGKSSSRDNINYGNYLIVEMIIRIVCQILIPSACELVAAAGMLLCCASIKECLRLSNASLIYGSQTEKGINRDINAVLCTPFRKV